MPKELKEKWAKEKKDQPREKERRAEESKKRQYLMQRQSNKKEKNLFKYHPKDKNEEVYSISHHQELKECLGIGDEFKRAQPHHVVITNEGSSLRKTDDRSNSSISVLQEEVPNCGANDREKYNNYF